MTTETEPAAATRSSQDWERGTPLSFYRTPAFAAGSVAWEVLNHSAHHADEIRAFLALEMPEIIGGGEGDAWTFLNDVIGIAGQVGYAFAKVDTRDITYQGEESALGVQDAARAVAALLRLPIVEDEAVAS